jgi:antirestriction protein
MATEDDIEPDLFEILSELNEDELKIFAAYRSNFDGSWRECQDAYVGQYKSHKDFAYEWAESCGDIQQDVKWPYTCINWNDAAQDLMQGFFEDNGFYFYSR